MISKSVKIIVVVLLGLACIGQISNQTNPPKAQPVVRAQMAPAKPIDPTASYEKYKREAQERQEREAKFNAVNRGEISFCEAFKSDLQKVTGIQSPCLK